MSWNGTVRCGHCFGRGHNRRGCPQIKAQIAANPNSYLAQDEKYKKEQHKTRACGWCKEPGHNKTTCSHKKNGESKLSELTSHVKTQLNHVLSIAGFGRGAVLKRTLRGTSVYGTVLSGIYKHNVIWGRGGAVDHDYLLHSQEPSLLVHWVDAGSKPSWLPTFTDSTKELLNKVLGKEESALGYWGYGNVTLVAASNEPLEIDIRCELQHGQLVDALDAWIVAVKESVKKCEDHKKSVKNA